jgi:hypothetical protein
MIMGEDKNNNAWATKALPQNDTITNTSTPTNTTSYREITNNDNIKPNVDKHRVFQNHQNINTYLELKNTTRQHGPRINNPEQRKPLPMRGAINPDREN